MSSEYVCFLVILETTAAGFRKLSGSEFQTVGSATGKARLPNVLRRHALTLGRSLTLQVPGNLQTPAHC